MAQKCVEQCSRGCRGTESHGRGPGGVPRLFLPPSRLAAGGPREYQLKKKRIILHDKSSQTKTIYTYSYLLDSKKFFTFQRYYYPIYFLHAFLSCMIGNGG